MKTLQKYGSMLWSGLALAAAGLAIGYLVASRKARQLGESLGLVGLTPPHLKGQMQIGPRLGGRPL